VDEGRIDREEAVMQGNRIRDGGGWMHKALL
jgi:hypothetical protein